MKVVSILILAVLCSSTLAHIVLDIQPDELQRIAEILVQNYVDNNLGPLPRAARMHFFFHHVKKFGFTTMNMFGLIFSLTSANVITSMIELKYGLIKPSSTTSIPSSSTSTTITPSLFKLNNYPEMCDNIVRFGCDRNVCWRTCNSQNVTANSLCYTSPTPEIHDYHHCTHSTDCSPCWECVDLCKTNFDLLAYDLYINTQHCFLIHFFHYSGRQH